MSTFISKSIIFIYDFCLIIIFGNINTWRTSDAIMNVTKDFNRRSELSPRVTIEREKKELIEHYDYHYVALCINIL